MSTWEHVRLMPGTRINEYRCIHCRGARYAVDDHGLRCTCAGAKDDRTRRVARADQKGVAIPKLKKVRSRKSRAAACPESIIQNWANATLEAMGIPFLRLGESLLLNIFRNPSIPIHIKRHIKEAIAGWPDNILFLPITNHFSLCCMAEFKSDVGELHGKQKERAKELPFNVIRTTGELDELLKAFKDMAEYLKHDLTGKLIIGRRFK
jgi:hypothetical protein